MIYMDHNATSPVMPAARQAWVEAVETGWGNPSSPHRLGSRAEAALHGARERLARQLDCDPLDLVWTSGATEANNLAWHHLARILPSHLEVWVSAIEHPSVLEPARHYFPSACRLLPVTREGLVDVQWLSDHLSRHPPGVVAVMAANNETGVLQPWRQIQTLCRQHGVPFFCDAVQWLGKLPAQGLGQCDLLSGGAHKWGGPPGIGFLKCPAHGVVRPLLHGGPQESGRRAGTENLPGALSLVAALEARQAQLESGDVQVRLSWRRAFEAGLESRLPGAQCVGGKQVERLWNTVSVILPATHQPIRWVVKLDKAGCAVSTGSACASGKEEPSHVLAAMGLRPEEAAQVIRISSGWETPPEHWQTLLEALETVYRDANR